jgi:hypothetical protein
MHFVRNIIISTGEKARILSDHIFKLHCVVNTAYPHLAWPPVTGLRPHELVATALIAQV